MVYLPPTTTNKSLITAYELSLESGTFGHLAGDTWQQLSAGCSTSVWLQTLAGLDENMAPDSPDALVCQLCPFCPTEIPESKLPKELHSSWQKDGWLHNPDTGVFLEPGGQKLWFDTEASTREGFAAKMVSSDSTYSVHFEDSLAGSVGLYDTVIYGHIRECLCSIYAQAREYQELYEAWSKRT